MFEKENRCYSAPFGLPLPLSKHLGDRRHVAQADQ